MKRLLLVFSLASLAALISCSTFNKAAIRPTSGLLYKASEELETEDDWERFRESVPSNLKLLESLLYVDPHNEKLQTLLVKGHTSYALAVYETMMLSDTLIGKSSPDLKERAIEEHSRAMKIGENFLEQNGITYQQLLEAASKGDHGVTDLLSSHLSKSNDVQLEAVLFLGQALASLINLQKNSSALVAQTPVLEGLYDWVCKVKPDIAFGACQMFYASYMVGRPKMLGGDPEKGAALFKEAITKYPENWLIRIFYLQMYVIPIYDENEFKFQMAFLEIAHKRFTESKQWNHSKEKIQTTTNKRLRFYQALALKRYEILKANQSKIF